MTIIRPGFHYTANTTTTTQKSLCFDSKMVAVVVVIGLTETRLKSHVVWQSVNKIQAILQVTGQAVNKKWFVKVNLSWKS